MTKLLKQMFPTVFNFGLSITIGIQIRIMLLQQKTPDCKIIKMPQIVSEFQVLIELLTDLLHQQSFILNSPAAKYVDKSFDSWKYATFKCKSHYT